MNNVDLREALTTAAVTLARPEPAHLLEADLQSALRSALSEQVATRDGDLVVADKQHRLRLHGFEGVGPVDVAITTD